MSHMHKLGLGTSLCFHETNSFVVQPYEPIPLIVLPYRLLVCSKSSKSSHLDPGTHAITILWTSRPIVADGNIQFLAHHAPNTCNHHIKESSPISSRRELNQFHAHHVSSHQAHPRPLLDLVLQAQTSHHMHIQPNLGLNSHNTLTST